MAAKIRTFVLPLVGAMLLLTFAAPALAANVPVQPGSAAAYDFPPASSCTCHDALLQEWRRSMHVRALIDPVFQVKVNKALAEAGPETALYCKRCHSPIGNMTGDPDGVTNLSASEGVTCMFCHQAVADSGAHANVSQLLNPDLTRRAQLSSPVAPHPAAFSEYQASSEMCGGCHDVNHPTNGLHLDTTYTEWKASPYAKNGTSCQSCHMSTTAGVPGASAGQAAKFGLPRSDIFGMTFVGANVGQGPADASAAMLKSAAEITITVPSVVVPGSMTELTVTVTNKGAGHDLPTGLTEERQMWLTVSVVNGDGSVRQIGEQHFGTVYEDAQGHFPAEIWNATSIHSDHRIPAKGASAVTYTFVMPVGAEQSNVVALLWYRSLSDKLAADAHVDNPTTEMASAHKTIYANQALLRAHEATDSAIATESSATIWTLLTIALAFAAVVGVLSVGIVSAQR